MIYLHIGPHKTATTYIQHCFHASKDVLLNEGYLYSDVGIEKNTSHVAHHDLAHKPEKYLEESGEHHPALVDLGSQLRDGNKRLVMSAEGFSTWPAERFLKLADILNQEKISISFAIRDPFDLFFSFWGEEVKQGRTSSLTDRFSEHLLDPLSSRLLNPAAYLRTLVAEDRIKVDVLFYDQIQSQNIDIFETMLGQWLDISSITKPQVKSANERFPIELTEFLRILTVQQSAGKRHIGSGLRLLFTQSISTEFRTEIIRTVAQYGSASRRRLIVRRDGLLVQLLEKRIKLLLDDVTHTPIPAGPIFRRDQSVLFYYDIFSLSEVPEVKELLKRTRLLLNLD